MNINLDQNRIVKLSIIFITGASSIHSTSLSSKKNKIINSIEKLAKEEKYNYGTELIEAINKYKSDINSCTNTDKLKDLLDNYDVHILSNIIKAKKCGGKYITALIVLINGVTLVRSIGKIFTAYNTIVLDSWYGYFSYYFAIGSILHFTRLGISSYISKKELNKFKIALELALKRENRALTSKLEVVNGVPTSKLAVVGKKRKAINKDLNLTKSQLAVVVEENSDLASKLEVVNGVPTSKLAVVGKKRKAINKDLNLTKSQLAVVGEENSDLASNLVVKTGDLSLNPFAANAKSQLAAQHLKSAQNSYTKICVVVGCFFLTLLSLAIACYVYHTELFCRWYEIVSNSTT